MVPSSRFFQYKQDLAMPAQMMLLVLGLYLVIRSINAPDVESIAEHMLHRIQRTIMLTAIPCHGDQTHQASALLLLHRPYEKWEVIPADHCIG